MVLPFFVNFFRNWTIKMTILLTFESSFKGENPMEQSAQAA